MRKINNQSSNPTEKAISGWKKIVFSSVLILIPILIFLMLEFGLRIFNYGNDLSLFLKSENYPGYMEINRDVNLRYFTKLGNTSPTDDIFLINKPDTCYRVFVFGGSTTRGFPYQAGTAFPRILYYRLQDAFPQKRIEVINLSASAINSYSYIDMIDEVLDSKPDAILLYGGHNEYYGALGIGSVENGGNARWIKKLRLKLGKLRTFQLVQNMITGVASAFSGTNDKADATLMERIVKDKDIPMNSSLFMDGVIQFDKNLDEFVRKAKDKNIPVILSELVSNIKDQVPLDSNLETGNSEAIEVFNKAKSLEEQGQIAEAKKLYYQAKDLDAIRFRAPEAFNDVISNISKKYQLPVVPMKRYFEDASANGLIGDRLMIDHLHPTIDGYFLMADAFFNEMKDRKFVSSVWEHSKINPSSFYRNNWGFTELDSLIGGLNIQSLKAGWPFKPVTELNTFLESYNYTSYVDSMAFSYLTKGERHIEDEHIKLAQYYAELGLKENAFEEYFSLIKLHPYIGDLYYDAIKYLIPLEKYSEALNLLTSAPNIEKDYYFYYMTGTLKLKLNEISQAINDLEYSYKNITKDGKPLKILIPLYAAYRESGNGEKMKQTLELIRKYNPEYARGTEIDDQNRIVKTITFDQIFENARIFIQNKDYNKAQELLIASIKVKETATANKLIGIINILQKEYDTAYGYCLKSYQLDPKDSENLINLFNLNLMKNNFTNAEKNLNELKLLNVDGSKIHQLENLLKKKEIAK